MNNIVKIILFLFLFWGGSIQSFSKGIIIASDMGILKKFRDSNEEEISKFAKEISLDYDKVILHLGSEVVFRRGGPFFYKTSKENLKTFSNILKENQVELYFWILDSFGGKAFLEIYESYQKSVDENLKNLNEMEINYNGIVIDLEWINKEGYNNNEKYIGILKYIRKNIGDKKLLAFASLIESQEENLKRGYDEEEISKISEGLITMLYPLDGGFYLKNNHLNLYLTDNRINSIKNYLLQKRHKIAFSVVGGIVLERNESLYLIKNFVLKKGLDLTDLELEYANKFDYYDVYGYNVLKPKKVIKNDGKEEQLEKNDKIHIVEINYKKIEDDYFLWEYFLIKEDEQ